MHAIEQNYSNYKNQPTIKHLNTLLKSSERLVYNICYQTLKHHQNAEDATQKAFLKLLKVINKTINFQHFSNLLYKISIHTCINDQRSRKRRKIREEKAHEVIYTNRLQTDNSAQKPSIREHVNLLDEELRGIVSEYYFDDVSLKGLSQSRHCSSSTICNRLHTAKKRLRESLTAELSA